MATQFLESTKVPIKELIASVGDNSQQEIPSILPIPVVPNYTAFLQTIVVYINQGSNLGILDGPRGVSIEPTTDYIYVVGIGGGQIRIFSQTRRLYQQVR